jgi:hypothetical protein
MRKHARMCAVSAALALLPSLVLFAGTTSASAAVCPRSGISGFVTAPSGAPVAVAGVDLFIEPDVASVADDEPAELTLIGHTLTDGAGCYALAYPNASTLLAAADSVGHLDLTILVHRPGKLEFRTLPVMLTTAEVGGDVHLDVVAATSAAAFDDSGNVDRSSAVLGDFDQSFGGIETSAVDSADQAPTGDPEAVASQRDVVSTVVADPTTNSLSSTGGVRWVKRQGYGSRSVVVGQFWSTMDGVKQTWTYGRGATSELGAAWSVTGAAGSFSHSDTWTEASTASVTFPPSHGKVGNYYRTNFRFGLFDEQVYDYILGRWIYVGSAIRETSWERGVSVTTGVPVPSTAKRHCEMYNRGAKDHTSTSVARTWSDGVSLSGQMAAILGDVTLSSRTGYDVHARNDVTFIRSGWLCGVDGPLSRPGAMVARRFK